MSVAQPSSGGAHISSLPLNVLILLFDKITAHVPIPDVIALSQTHSMLMDKLSVHLRKAFDELLASRISRGNVKGFRALLLKTRAAISGSTTLHFILRENRWKPGDFDLYAPLGTGYAIVHWLIANEAYRIVSDGSKSFTFHPHTVIVPADNCDWLTDLGDAPAASRRLRRSKMRYGSTDSDIYRVYKLCSTNGTFVDVIESSKPSFLPPITKFHSTLVMNYLTPDSIVVLYPKLTFRREGILQYRDENTLESYDDPNHQPIDDTPAARTKQDYVSKYKSRGFTLYSRPADLLRSCGAACPSIRRVVSSQVDEWALQIKFADSTPTFRKAVVASFLPSDPINTAAFPDISGKHPTDTVEAQSSQPPPSSWASSYVADFAEEFSELSIEQGDAAQTGPDPSDTDPSRAGISRDLVCTRPPLPETQWSLQAPPLANQGTRQGRRVRGVCRNPCCPL